MVSEVGNGVVGRRAVGEAGARCLSGGGVGAGCPGVWDTGELGAGSREPGVKNMRRADSVLLSLLAPCTPQFARRVAGQRGLRHVAAFAAR